MKRMSVIGATVVALASVATGAGAADLAATALPPAEFVPTPASAYDWSGIYAGLAFGYG